MVNCDKNVFVQHKIRDFMLTSAFYFSLAAYTAKAQAQTLMMPEKNQTQDKHRTAMTYDINVGADNISALIVDKNTATFYNDLTPNISFSLEDKQGNGAKVSVAEQIVYDGNEFSHALDKLMIECYKKVKNDGELFLMVGRDNTQGSGDVPLAIDYMADTSDDEAFSNNAPYMVLGYRKNENFFELGIIQNTNSGEYTFIPNMKNVDFFGRGYLSATIKNGGEIGMELAAHLGKYSRLGIANINFTKGNFGAKALVQYDFMNEEAKCLVRAYQKLKSGAAIIGEIAHRGKECGVDFRLGAGKNGLQVFTQYNTRDKLLQCGASYTFSLNKRFYNGNGCR